MVRPTTRAALQVRLYSDRRDGPKPRLIRCYDAPAEARRVAEEILANVEDGMRLRDQAVLMRAGHHSDLLEIELTARRIPFRKYGGLRFLEAAHAKDFPSWPSSPGQPRRRGGGVLASAPARRHRPSASAQPVDPAGTCQCPRPRPAPRGDRGGPRHRTDQAHRHPRRARRGTRSLHYGRSRRGDRRNASTTTDPACP